MSELGGANYPKKGQCCTVHCRLGFRRAEGTWFQVGHVGAGLAGFGQPVRAWLLPPTRNPASPVEWQTRLESSKPQNQM